MKCFYDLGSGEIRGFMDDASAIINTIEGTATIDVEAAFNPNLYQVVEGKVTLKNATPDLNEQLYRVRDIRNQFLAKSDWTQVPDSPLTPEKKLAWAEYRSQLRDFTDNWYPEKPWPVEP